MYSQEVIDHFEHPRNVGELENASVAARVENPACGDIMELALRVEDGSIRMAKYRARGCVAAIASGSVLTEKLQAMSVEAARKLRREDLLAVLGRLGPEQMHATQLAIDALGAVLAKLS